MSSPVSMCSNISSNCSLNSTDGKKLPQNKIQTGMARNPNLKNVKSKIGSLNNVHHRPAGGDKKVETQKLKWETKPRVGSLENATHKAKGGNVKVTTQKLEWNVKSKVGSLDNVKHNPGGGNIKIFDEKYSNKAGSLRSGESTPNPTSRTPNSITTTNNNNVDELLKHTQEKLKISP